MTVLCNALLQPQLLQVSACQGDNHKVSFVNTAGYQANEKPLPRKPPLASVLDYGAVGDGVTDDTAAFVRAVETMPEGVLYIPAGRYRIKGFINITRAVSLRGAGSDLTTLWFSEPLAALYGDVGRNA